MRGSRQRGQCNAHRNGGHGWSLLPICLGVTRHAPSRSRSTDPLQSRAPRRRRSRLTRLRRPRVGRWAHERARGWAWWAHMDGAGGRRAGGASHRRPQAASTARRTGRAAAADVGRSGGWVGPLCAREGGRGAGCAHLGLDLGLIAPSREHEDVSHHRGATPLPEGCCLRATSLRRVDPRTILATNGGAAAHGRLAGAVARRGAMCPPWRARVTMLGTHRSQPALNTYSGLGVRCLC